MSVPNNPDYTYFLQYIYQELQQTNHILIEMVNLKRIEIKMKLGLELIKRDHDLLGIPNKDVKIDGVET